MRKSIDSRYDNDGFAVSELLVIMWRQLASSPLIGHILQAKKAMDNAAFDKLSGEHIITNLLSPPFILQNHFDHSNCLLTIPLHAWI